MAIQVRALADDQQRLPLLHRKPDGLYLPQRYNDPALPVSLFAQAISSSLPHLLSLAPLPLLRTCLRVQVILKCKERRHVELQC